ncbi:hypothetical protein NEHOM01_1750 [Nematocida homosporus]|uniref:uncharacterized protein n=1 Tax=Nematocida homosporus TaxID=1912981 RepID=UPI00221EDFED|nr:uncharacterized protein NEHOM01_1750 [Nematocida homosporus]KAI5186855.1 hypothetical protein NEHOM01_1750 [Nematocida homosporus]
MENSSIYLSESSGLDNASHPTNYDTYEMSTFKPPKAIRPAEQLDARHSAPSEHTPMANTLPRPKSAPHLLVPFRQAPPPPTAATNAPGTSTFIPQISKWQGLPSLTAPNANLLTDPVGLASPDLPLPLAHLPGRVQDSTKPLEDTHSTTDDFDSLPPPPPIAFKAIGSTEPGRILLPQPATQLNTNFSTFKRPPFNRSDTWVSIPHEMAPSLPYSTKRPSSPPPIPPRTPQTHPRLATNTLPSKKNHLVGQSPANVPKIATIGHRRRVWPPIVDLAANSQFSDSEQGNQQGLRRVPIPTVPPTKNELYEPPTSMLQPNDSPNSLSSHRNLSGSSTTNGLVYEPSSMAPSRPLDYSAPFGDNIKLPQRETGKKVESGNNKPSNFSTDPSTGSPTKLERRVTNIFAIATATTTVYLLWQCVLPCYYFWRSVDSFTGSREQVAYVTLNGSLLTLGATFVAICCVIYACMQLANVNVKYKTTHRIVWRIGIALGVIVLAAAVLGTSLLSKWVCRGVIGGLFSQDDFWIKFKIFQLVLILVLMIASSIWDKAGRKKKWLTKKGILKLVLVGIAILGIAVAIGHLLNRLSTGQTAQTNLLDTLKNAAIAKYPNSPQRH